MKLKFQVRGMTCAACSARVEKVTGAVSGVEKAEVNLLAGTMTVEAADEARFEEHVEQHQIERAEDANHKRFQNEKRDHVFLDALLDRFP